MHASLLTAPRRPPGGAWLNVADGTFGVAVIELPA
jgi:hypothetical protein